MSGALLMHEREVVIDYLARVRAELLAVSSADVLSDIGRLPALTEEGWYEVLRSKGVDEWKLKPLNEWTTHDLLTDYIERFDPLEPDEHLMDFWVIALVFRYALA